MLHIAIVADGEPHLAGTNSGVALGLVRALEGRADVEVVAKVSSAPSPALRLLVLIASWRPSMGGWRLAARRGPVARWMRSSVRSHRLRRAGLSEESVVVHVRNVYRPTRWRYVSFIDTTIAASAAGWSKWDRAHPGLTAFERRYYDSASVICVAAEAARTSLIENYEQPDQKVVRVGGGTNFRPAPELVGERRDRVDDRGVVVLFVGKDFERKGGDLLVEAIRLLQAQGVAVRLRIVGAAVDVSGPGLEVVGPVLDRDQLWDLYREADVFCLPARWEPYGLVVQEAMAAGLPVVVSETGELPSIVSDAGVVVRAPGPLGVAAALRPLLEDRELRAALGSAAVERVSEQLSWDHVADRMVSAIRSTAASERGVGA